jgi:tetratricopeptide (TPR) repeat protein
MMRFRPSAGSLAGAAAVAMAVAVILVALSALADTRTEEARKLVERGENDRAEDLLLETITGDPEDAEAHFLLAKVYLRKQEHDLARHEAERAVEIDDSVSKYQLWLARTYLAAATESGFINAFRYAWKGKKAYEKAVELDSANVEARLELCMYLVAAPGLVGGSLKKGREQAKAVEMQDSLYGSYAWASVLEREGDLEQTEAYLKRAVRLDTTSTLYARHALGYFYERNDRLDDAGKIFGSILEERPDDLIALFQVGKICAESGSDLNRAESCLSRYLDSEIPPNGPSRASAHWRLGTVYDLQGRTGLAVEELRRAVELAPENKRFRKTLEDARKKLEKRGQTPISAKRK